MEAIRRRRRDADSWREILARHGGSGLTVQAFCEREAISVASFYSWRAKLCGSATEEPVTPAPAAGFVDLGVLSAGAARFEVRLDLGGGVLLHLVRR